MKLFPAIDILDGKAVRLLYGDRTRATVYGDPEEYAERWRSAGAKELHVVDLNGAFGDGDNLETVRRIVEKTGLSVQLGGGVKSLEAIKTRIETGVSRVIVGTLAVENPELMRLACAQYGNKIVCGVDVKDGQVAIKGWVERSGVTARELCADVKAMGVDTVIYTDISRDGALTGVNVEETADLQRESGLKVIASGGVSGIDDILMMRGRVYGAILGRALYSGTLDLRAALAAAED